MTLVGVDAFQTDEAFALALDAQDPLAAYRERFHIPVRGGSPVIYLCGNSLGLQPRSARARVEQELDDWANLAVDAHFDGATPWYSYHEIFREIGARVVGARPGEVVMMNGLTVNLHLMLTSFFRPTASRFKILMEWPEFPSDIYAVKTHLRSRGLDPDDALITIEPREGEHLIRHDDLAAVIGAEGDSIAVILMSGVNYFTGQLFDLASITELGHRHGCMVGFDLAHTAGNVPLELHGWDVDFACWCSYKYLNSGPGAVAGCFVHERHGANPDLPRLAGWWGNDPETRFKMHLLPEFTPRAGADGWQLSNPPIMALAPVKSSLDIFDEVGMPALREKSLRLSGYLRWLVEQIPTDRFEIVTPPAPWCGCQVSMLVHDGPRPLFEALHDAGVVGDVREPNVIRVAPVPLYNSYHEVWRFARILATETGQETG